MEGKRRDRGIVAPLVVALISLAAIALFAFVVTSGIEPKHALATSGASKDGSSRP